MHGTWRAVIPAKRRAAVREPGPTYPGGYGSRLSLRSAGMTIVAILR
jgi:hypothetical protein